MPKAHTHRPVPGAENTEWEKSFADILIQSFSRAAKSFSELLMQDMELSDCRIELMTGEQFIDRIAENMEEGYFASIIRLPEELNTVILFLLSEEEGRRLYRSLDLASDGGMTGSLEDMVESVGELNNILGNNFVNSLANTLNLSIHGSVPRNTLDLLGAILQSVILQNEFTDKHIFCAEAEISDRKSTALQVRLIILSDKTKMMKAIRRSEEP